MNVNELNGEKIDIVPFSDDLQEFVAKALAPARVTEVRINMDMGTAEVIVPDFQLSLAIGKEGQNARLAARLTGWRVDIKSESQLAEDEAGGGVIYAEEGVDYAEGEWVEGEGGDLVWQPAGGGDAISAAEAGYEPIEEANSQPGGDDTVIASAEEAAMHVIEDADEVASDSELEGAAADDRAEADVAGREEGDRD
jgi:N utilization substance protein A